MTFYTFCNKKDSDILQRILFEFAFCQIYFFLRYLKHSLSILRSD